jgi:hypothetical protein
MDYKGLHQCIYPRERAQTFSTFSKIAEKVVTCLQSDIITSFGLEKTFFKPKKHKIKHKDLK